MELLLAISFDTAAILAIPKNTDTNRRVFSRSGDEDRKNPKSELANPDHTENVSEPVLGWIDASDRKAFCSIFREI